MSLKKIKYLKIFSTKIQKQQQFDKQDFSSPKANDFNAPENCLLIVFQNVWYLMNLINERVHHIHISLGEHCVDCSPKVRLICKQNIRWEISILNTLVKKPPCKKHMCRTICGKQSLYSLEMIWDFALQNSMYLLDFLMLSAMAFTLVLAFFFYGIQYSLFHTWCMINTWLTLIMFITS